MNRNQLIFWTGFGLICLVVPVALALSTLVDPLYSGWIAAVAATVIGAVFTYAQYRRTMNKQAEFDGRVAEARGRFETLRAVVNKGVYGILSLDDSGVIKLSNGTVNSMLGYSDAQPLVGRHFTEAFDEESLNEAGIFLDFMKYPRLEHGKRSEVTARRADGSTFPAEVDILDLETYRGRQLYIYVIDITDRKERDERLKGALREAQSATQAKSAFMASMSHEVRTPMSAILGLAELCLRTNLDERQRDYVQKLNHTAGMMLDVLNGILDYSKIEAGHLEFDETAYELDVVLEDVVTVGAVKARDKGLELLVDRDVNLPPQLIGDPAKLRQVLLNLIVNAIKFTEAGEVELGIRLVGHDNQNCELELYVRDSGIGMSVQQQSELFRPFMQADGSISRRYGGTGLGLYISKVFIERMGGNISVTSSPGSGATFVFNIVQPMLAQPAGSRFRVSEDFVGHQALVVDDNKRSQSILAKYLEAFGMNVMTCDTRSLGSDIVRLQDLKLAVIDVDDEASTQALRTIRRENADVTVIALASDPSGVPEEIVRDTANTIAKPTNPSLFFNAIIGAADGDMVSVESKRPEAISLAGKRILLVEDNAINQQVALGLMEVTGAIISVVDNGEKAVAAVQENSYDCVLMDVQMPVMDGLEATRRIRQLGFTDLPILAMTANAMMEEREATRSAGMDAHIAKPIDSSLLLRTLSRFMNSEDDAKPAADEDVTLIDAREALARLDHNEPLYQSLLKAFATENTQDVVTIWTALEQGRADEAKLTAHTLKGLAHMLGARQLYEAVKKVDRALAEKKEVAAEELDQVQDLLTRTINQINRMSESDSSGEPVAARNEGLDVLKQKIEQMDPGVDEAYSAIRGSLEGCPPNLLESLSRELDSFDFEGAYQTVTRLEQVLNETR